MRKVLVPSVGKVTGKATGQATSKTIGKGRDMWRFIVLSLGAVLGLGCAGEDTRTLSLSRVQPAIAPGCGAPANGRTLLLRALGDFAASEGTARSVELGSASSMSGAAAPLVALGDLPASDTVQLTVEVIGTGGSLAAIGKSVPLAMAQLDDDARVPVLMAPPEGACPTGLLQVPRLGARLARVDDGALVVGGVNGDRGDGAAVTAVERYDGATASFVLVTDSLYENSSLGIRGASATSLGRGRVVIAGGPVSAYAVYDRARDAVSSPLPLPVAHAFHAAVAIGDDQVLLAGGCAVVAADGLCDPDTLVRTTAIIDLAEEVVRAGPRLELARVGGVATVEGTVGPGVIAVLVAGGVDGGGEAVTDAERIFVEVAGDTGGGSAGSEIVADVGGALAPLAAGGVVSGFAPAGATAHGAVTVVPPGADGANEARGMVDGTAIVARAGATVTALEDGGVLILGGQAPAVAGQPAAAEALVYEPAQHRVRALDAVVGVVPAVSSAFDTVGAWGPTPAHGAMRLSDGTVLVVGGVDDAGGPQSHGWIIRPSLVGPLATEATAVLDSGAEAELARFVVARDPRQGAFIGPGAGDDGGPGFYHVRSSASSGLPSEWLVLAGAEFSRVAIDVGMSSAGGGAAVLFGFRGPYDHAALILIAGQPASLFRIEGGTVRAVVDCTGQVVTAGDLGGPGEVVTVSLQVGTGGVTATAQGREVLTCAATDDVARGTLVGRVGVGVIGATDAALDVYTLRARRLAP